MREINYCIYCGDWKQQYETYDAEFIPPLDGGILVVSKEQQEQYDELGY